MDDLVQQMLDTSSAATKEKAEMEQRVVTDPAVLVDKLSRIVSCIDVSNVARAVGDIGSAGSALNQARGLAIELLGLQE